MQEDRNLIGISERERFVVNASLAVIALYAVLDALFVIEPGTNAGDHLFAAIVPVLLIAAVAFAYPRTKAGWRAAMVGLTGMTAVSFAIAGVAERQTLPIPTAILAGVAGVALVCVGVSVAWRSRKPSGHKLARRALIGFGIVLVAFELWLPVTVALVATHRFDGVNDVSNRTLEQSSSEIKTSDGLTLSGSYTPSRNGAAVIVFPDRSQSRDHAEMLKHNGYGVLALDMRGYGESEGEPNAYGWGAWRDVVAAVDFLTARPDVDDDRIGGLGLSVGGEQMIDAAAIDRRLKAVVSDGAGERSIREVVERGAAAALVLPQQAVLTTTTAILSGSAPPPSLTDQVARISPRALMLIEAERGTGGEERNADYLAAAGQPKQHWKVAGATHTDAIDSNRAEYERRVIGFFDRFLLDR